MDSSNSYSSTTDISKVPIPPLQVQPGGVTDNFFSDPTGRSLNSSRSIGSESAFTQIVPFEGDKTVDPEDEALTNIMNDLIKNYMNSKVTQENKGSLNKLDDDESQTPQSSSRSWTDVSPFTTSRSSVNTPRDESETILFNPLKSIGQPNPTILRGVAVKYKNGEYSLFPKTADKTKTNITFKKRERIEDCSYYTFKQGTNDAQYAKYFLRFFFSNYYDRLTSRINDNSFIEYTTQNIAIDYNSIDNYVLTFLSRNNNILPVTKYEYVMMIIYFQVKSFFNKNYKGDKGDKDEENTQCSPCWKKTIIDIASIFNSYYSVNENDLIEQIIYVIKKNCSYVDTSNDTSVKKLYRLVNIIIKKYFVHLDEFVVGEKEARRLTADDIAKLVINDIDAVTKPAPGAEAEAVTEQFTEENINDALKKALAVSLKARGVKLQQELAKRIVAEQIAAEQRTAEKERERVAAEKAEKTEEASKERREREEIGRSFLYEIENAVSEINLLSIVTSGNSPKQFYLKTITDALGPTNTRYQTFKDKFFEDDGSSKFNLRQAFPLSMILSMNEGNFNELNGIDVGPKLRAYVVDSLLTALNSVTSPNLKSVLLTGYSKIIQSFIYSDLENITKESLQDSCSIEYYLKIMNKIKLFNSKYSGIVTISETINNNINTLSSGTDSLQQSSKATVGGFVHKPKSFFSTRKARELPTTLLKKRLPSKNKKRVTFKNI